MSEPKPPKTFAAAGEEKEASLAGEIFAFLRYNKKWWLLPIILVLLAFGVLAFLGSTSLAPLIYTLF